MGISGKFAFWRLDFDQSGGHVVPITEEQYEYVDSLHDNIFNSSKWNGKDELIYSQLISVKDESQFESIILDLAEFLLDIQHTKYKLVKFDCQRYCEVFIIKLRRLCGIETPDNLADPGAECIFPGHEGPRQIIPGFSTPKQHAKNQRRRQQEAADSLRIVGQHARESRNPHFGIR